jgi:hypothetical protein
MTGSAGSMESTSRSVVDPAAPDRIAVIIDAMRSGPGKGVTDRPPLTAPPCG